MSKHTFYNILISIWLAILAHILKGYDKSINTTDNSMFNMLDLENGLWYSMVDLFSSGGIPIMESTLCHHSILHAPITFCSIISIWAMYDY